MNLIDKRVWIRIILIVGLIALISRLVFYRYDVKFEEIYKVLNTVDHGENSFYPYGYALIHNDVDLEGYKLCRIPWIDSINNYDFEKFSYLITFGNPVNKLSYSWYDTFRYDCSPSYAKVWKDYNQLLIVDYRDFIYRYHSIEDNEFRGNDSVYIYKLPHLPFLRGMQGL